MGGPKVAVSINTSWNFINFRAGLLQALLAEGFHVLAVSPADEYTGRLIDMGVEHVPLAIDPSSLSPIDGVSLTSRYAAVLRRHRPDVYLSYTPKPNVFGSLAAHMLGIPVINNIAGLGRAFIEPGLLSFAVSRLFKLALARSKVVFFQNSQDRDDFLALGCVRPEQVLLLPGSGVDLTRFAPSAQPRRDDGKTLVFLLVSRLLKAKGIAEFAEAARMLRRSHPHLRFRLVGIEQSGPDAVSGASLAAWAHEGILEHFPTSDDIRIHLADADCVVLPTRYREGTPRILLEASAMGKPLIATDMPGCRDVVIDGVNGFLCGTGDAGSLADAMRKMADLSPAERATMGYAARMHAEAHFDEKLVIEAYLQAIRQVLR